MLFVEFSIGSDNIEKDFAYMGLVTEFLIVLEGNFQVKGFPGATCIQWVAIDYNNFNFLSTRSNNQQQ